MKNNNRLTNYEFISRAKKIHGSLYGYEHVDYVNNHSKVKIICPEHGEFFQAPVNHVNQKQGCPKCGLKKNSDRQRSNSDEFKKRAQNVHGKKYDYSKVDYVGGHQKIIITCPEHGDFEQTPQAHLSGRRCPDCARISSTEKRIKWTKEEVYKEASKYTIMSDFQTKGVGAYASAKKNGWLDDVRKNFIIKKRYWTKDDIQKIANKYIHRGEFCTENGAACKYAKDRGWYEDIVRHMVPVGNKYNRLVYVFEFPDKSVYVGLTGNITKRQKSHMEVENNSAVKVHMIKINKTPILKIISDGYIDYIDAQNMEHITLQKYKTDGWNILNRTKTGSLGSSNRKWTLEKLKELVKNYKTRSEFLLHETNAYAAIARNGWLSVVFQDVKRLINPNGTWTFDVVAKEASKYNKKKDFFQNSPHAYYAAKSKGWFNEMTKNYTK